MGAFTSYGRSRLLTGLFVSASNIGTTYVALTSVIPGTANDVTRLVEPVGNGYARVMYLLDWEEGQPGEMFNKTAITFPTPTADWGTIRGWSLLSSGQANVIACGELRQTVVVKSGMSVVIPVHGIRLVLR